MRSRSPAPSRSRELDLSATAKLDNWWKPKATNLLVVLYAVVAASTAPFSHAAPLLAASVVTILGIGSFGHLVNDWRDVAADRRVGKRNLLGDLAPGARWALLSASLLIAALPWLWLPFDRISITLLSIEAFLLLAYALPPLRLKETLWAPLADGAYAYALPAVLATHTALLSLGRALDPTLAACLIVWQLPLGVRHFLNHVALDRANDLTSGTTTLATRRGNRYVHGLIRRVLLPLETVGFLALVALLTRENRTAGITVLVALGLFSLPHVILAIGRGYPPFTYRFSKVPRDAFYQDLLPLVLVGLLIVEDRGFLVLAVIHLALFYTVDTREFRDRLEPPEGLAQRGLYSLRAWLISFPAYLIERSLAGADRPPRQDYGTADAVDRGEERSADPAGQRSSPAIAVVNINKSKYTETFVQGMVGKLGFRTHYLHGSELPLWDHEDRHFLSKWYTFRLLLRLIETTLQLEPDYFLKQSITSYLQSRRIRLVLAEFGPVGAAMAPLTRDLGLPLVAYFHGYDVYHRDAVDRAGSRYSALFEGATRIIGVSERMVDRLERMGAPRERLVHLPAFVDLERFPYSDRSELGPRFLAVGRFSETKSPHLTLLAFREVVDRIPEATLRMIGKGGGGELFEACLIQARALGLEDRVEFLGVVSHQAVAEEMRRARIFVQHSVTTPETGDREGKPVAIMEAMASGLPVIATRHSGIEELIDSGETGRLVDEFDVGAMADVMIELAGDDAQVRRLGQNASERIHGDRRISGHVERLSQLIDDAIAQG